MAYIPGGDVELARQQTQTATRPLAAEERRRKAKLALVPEGAMTSAAHQALGTRMRGQTAMAMSDVGRKVGTDIFKTRSTEELQKTLQKGQLEQRESEFGRTFEAQQQARTQQLAMGGWTEGEGGQLTYSGGQVLDPETLTMVDPETLGRDVTQADIDRTSQYLTTRAAEEFAADRPEVRARHEEEAQAFYQENPQRFLEDNPDWSMDTMGLSQSNNAEVSRFLQSKDEDGLRNYLYSKLSRSYNRADVLARLEPIMEQFRGKGFFAEGGQV